MVEILQSFAALTQSAALKFDGIVIEWRSVGD
jgi:hypothetical protein